MGQKGENNRASASAANYVRQAASRAREKDEQLNIIKKTAKEQGIWIEDYASFGDYFSKGGENEVYFSSVKNSVFKLNNFEYAADDVSNFFDRIDIHNELFPESYYEIVGFTENSVGEISAVLEQSYVEAEREATESEIATYMEALGFEMDYSDSFKNDRYYVFDAFPNNVLMGTDGRLYFIDTQISRVK